MICAILGLFGDVRFLFFRINYFKLMKNEEKTQKYYTLKAEYNLRRQELHQAMREGKTAEYTSIRKDEVSFRAKVRDLSLRNPFHNHLNTSMVGPWRLGESKAIRKGSKKCSSANLSEHLLKATEKLQTYPKFVA